MVKLHAFDFRSFPPFDAESVDFSKTLFLLSGASTQLGAHVVDSSNFFFTVFIYITIVF